MQSYKAKNGAQQFKPAQDWIISAVENDENAGFCLACGDECEASSQTRAGMSATPAARTRCTARKN